MHQTFVDKDFFTGKEWEPETGTYYFGARRYDPTIGMWLGMDPVRQHFSGYVYGSNSPVNRFDPNGLLDIIIQKDDGTLDLEHWDSEEYGEGVEYVDIEGWMQNISTEDIVGLSDMIEMHNNTVFEGKFDAIGFTLSATLAFGGGGNGGISLIYFPNTDEIALYRSITGAIGVAGGASFTRTVGWYTGSSDQASADNFAGPAFGYNVGLGPLSAGLYRGFGAKDGNYFWGQELGAGASVPILAGLSLVVDIGRYDIINNWRLK